MKIAKYKHEDMEKALNALNKLSIAGIENAKRITLIATVIENPIVIEEEAEDGSSNR